LFDRDEHTRIPEAFRLAKANGIEVAFSHPSFDLWLLLHFQALHGRQNGSSELIHSKLRRHNGFESFARPSKRLLLPQREALSSAHADAHGRARQMIERCDFGRCSQHGHDPSCDPLQRDPSTDVWRLLNALGVTW
jgi:4-aminobutyrate aminotransferase-like enzyme